MWIDTTLPPRYEPTLCNVNTTLIANIIPQSANRIKLTTLDPYIADQFKPVFKSKVVKHMVSRKKRVSAKQLKPVYDFQEKSVVVKF